ncbi:Major Facilitator Superfamily protein [Ligilactobacillus ruminis DSM 20403 = NBRC 102161]|uniref:Major Facilitator Superfamily protein n=1 Tax=Ligilactobacillus ruminis DSM 20403 = NBRC 102161 TaxID=1423798 RepID=A0A1I2Q194_9LACO|nr:Major Facilitator Superfamily protein [Ligilactobacillus ruminis DSM 20403 = NBRC 102161]
MEKALLSSKTISTAGTLFFNAVIDLWVVQIFGSAKILGNTMAFTTLAAAICSFIGGYLADSSCRLRVLIMINAVSSLVCGIAFLEQKQLIGKPLTVYLLVFLLNIGSYLSSPLFKTITSISVEKTRIVAFNRSITFASQLCTVLIPPAATWLFAKKIIGLEGALLLNGLSFVLCSLLMVGLRKADGVKTAGNSNGYLGTIKLINNSGPLLFMALSGFILNFFLSGINVWLPYFTTKILHNASVYGVAISCQAVGGIIGALSIKKIKLDTSLRVERLGLVISCGLLMAMLFAISAPSLILAMFFLAAIITRYNIALQSLIQTHVEQKYIGKTFSTTYLIANLALPIASFLFGHLLNFSWKWLLVVVALGLSSMNLLWIIMKKRIIIRNIE